MYVLPILLLGSCNTVWRIFYKFIVVIKIYMSVQSFLTAKYFLRLSSIFCFISSLKQAGEITSISGIKENINWRNSLFGFTLMEMTWLSILTTSCEEWSGFDRTYGNLFASKRNTKVSLGVFSSRKVTPMISSKDVAQGKAMAEKLLAKQNQNLFIMNERF